MKIVHGITGNKYILGTLKEVQEVCFEIGKSEHSVQYVETHDCYVARVKSKKHKLRLKQLYG